MHETDDIGDITNTYAAGTSEEFGDLLSEGEGTIHQYDAQANTHALLDASGSIESKYKYQAFGQVAAVGLEGAQWSGLPHGKIRVTTAGEIRAAGGTVELKPENAWTRGPVNTWRVDVTEGPKSAFPEEASPNPVKSKDRLQDPDRK